MAGTGTLRWVRIEGDGRVLRLQGSGMNDEAWSGWEGLLARLGDLDDLAVLRVWEAL